MKRILILSFIVSLLCLSIPVSAGENLAKKLSGKILLAVEDHGKTYYVHEDGNRYRVTKDTAQSIFEQLALGISNKDLEKIPIKNLNIKSMDINTENPKEEVLSEKEAPKKADYAPYNDKWLKEQAEAKKEYPVILSITDDKGNKNESSNYNFQEGNSPNTETILKAGDIITITINAEDPKGRELYYTWVSGINSPQVISPFRKLTDDDFVKGNNVLTYTITNADIEKSKPINIIRVEGYIKSKKNKYRNPDGFDDLTALSYKTE